VRDITIGEVAFAAFKFILPVKEFHFGNKEKGIREEDQFQAHRDQKERKARQRQEGRGQEEERRQEEVGPA
jgi:hypothetical protein